MKKSSGVRLNDTRINFAVFSFFLDVNDDDADVYDDPFHDNFYALNFAAIIQEDWMEGKK